jgi:NAD(P)H-dependent FMN reductase
MPKLMVVIASTRPQRVGLAVGRWFVSRAEEHGGFDLDVADLAEIDLPFLDEPKHPRFHDYARGHTREWSARVEASDAFVFVTAEYNHGYPAPLKNAIDYLNQEWRDKPLGFVSYGGVSAGTRAVQQLKQVVTAVKLVPVGEAVHIPFVAQFIDESGAVQANEVMDQAATSMLDELLLMERALRRVREQRRLAAARA